MRTTSTGETEPGYPGGPALELLVNASNVTNFDTELTVGANYFDFPDDVLLKAGALKVSIWHEHKDLLCPSATLLPQPDDPLALADLAQARDKRAQPTPAEEAEPEEDMAAEEALDLQAFDQCLDNVHALKDTVYRKDDSC